MMTVVPSPFVKWAGGKKRLLDELHRRLPKELKENRIRRYIEPFVGGGAFFFSVVGSFKIDECVVNDKNEMLICSYRVVRDRPEDLVERLRDLQESYLARRGSSRVRSYYAHRDEFNSLMKKGISRNPVEASALFIFLNKTCYNGIFRLNSRGEFNVPIGSFTRPTICDKERVLAASSVLQPTKIVCKDFRAFLDGISSIGSETFMYVDPPYAIQNGHNGFLLYSDKIFSWKDQRDLARAVGKYRSNGVKIMMSNAHHKDISTLYEGFFMQSVERKTVIGAERSSRRTINEMIITSYPYPSAARGEQISRRC